MDPVSISAAALAFSNTLFGTGTVVWTFYEASRNVDRSLEALYRQINGLAAILKSLASTLEKPCFQDGPSEHGDLWNHVNDAMQSCISTIKVLEAMLDRISVFPNKPLNDNWNPNKAWRQFRLQLKQGDIDRLSTEIRTHSVNLQLALGIINVLISTSTPDTIIQEQAIRFERLERMILAVDKRLEPHIASPAPPMDAIVDSVMLDENTRSLRRSATSVMSSASTASGYSILGGVALAQEATTPVFDNLDVIEEYILEMEESTTGSEYGIPLQQSTRSHISGWIQDSTRLKDVDENEVASRSSTTSHTEQRPSVFSQASMISDTTRTDSTLEIFDDSSSDDDLEVRVAENIFSKANERFEKGEYADAENLLCHGLEQSHPFSTKKKQSLGLKNKQLKYGQCCWFTGNLGAANTVYAELARDPIIDSDDAFRVFSAMYGLAQLSLRRGNLEAAMNHCRQALRGQGKTKSIGKQHSDYYDSLRLLALIHWAKNEKVRAEAYSELLPGGHQLKPHEIDRILTVIYGWPSTDNQSDRDDKDGVTKLLREETEDQYASAQALALPTDIYPRLEVVPLHGSNSSRPHSDVRVGKEVALATIPNPRVPRRKDVAIKAASNLYERPQHPIPKTEVSTATILGSGNRPLKAGDDPSISIATAAEEAPLSIVPNNHRQASRNGLWCETVDVQGSKYTDNVSLRTVTTRSPANLGFADSCNPVSDAGIDISSDTSQLEAATALLKKHVLHSSHKADKAILWAAENSQLHAINLLLINGANPDAKDLSTFGSSTFDTPLHFAAANDNIAICTRLLIAGAPIEALNRYGSTPLAKATLYRRLEACKFLVNQGANVDGGPERSKYQVVTPLAIAIRDSKCLKVAEFLLSKGADREKRCGNGSTPLMLAAETNCLKGCDLMLRSGALVDAKKDNGRTALISAAANGTQEICDRLLMYGAKLTLQNQSGKTAVDWAKSKELKAYLLSKALEQDTQAHIG